jgi:hypothetical protein
MARIFNRGWNSTVLFHWLRVVNCLNLTCEHVTERPQREMGEKGEKGEGRRGERIEKEREGNSSVCGFHRGKNECAEKG